MNAKTTANVKKVLRHVPSHVVEAGVAIVIGKTLKGHRKTTGLVTAIGVAAIAHYIMEWAAKE